MIRILKFFGVSFLFLLVLYILLLTLPYVAHKKVPQEILDRSVPQNITQSFPALSGLPT